jgi:hypothetical protein
LRQLFQSSDNDAYPFNDGTIVSWDDTTVNGAAGAFVPAKAPADHKSFPPWKFVLLFSVIEQQSFQQRKNLTIVSALIANLLPAPGSMD